MKEEAMSDHDHAVMAAGRASTTGAGLTGEDRTTPRLVIRRQEFDRLRAIEEAARALVGHYDRDAVGLAGASWPFIEELRAALEGAPHE